MKDLTRRAVLKMIGMLGGYLGAAKVLAEENKLVSIADNVYGPKSWVEYNGSKFESKVLEVDFKQFALVYDTTSLELFWSAAKQYRALNATKFKGCDARCLILKKVSYQNKAVGVNTILYRTTLLFEAVENGPVNAIDEVRRIFSVCDFNLLLARYASCEVKPQIT